MGRKGWAGAPPADDDEARKRIVDATLRCIERRGAAQATLSDVAESLGITRRTIYRYFSGTDELFASVAEVALGGFVAQIEAVTADLEVTEQLIEVVAYIIEQLPHEPQLTLLLANEPLQRVLERSNRGAGAAGGFMARLCVGLERVAARFPPFALQRVPDVALEADLRQRQQAVGGTGHP